MLYMPQSWPEYVKVRTKLKQSRTHTHTHEYDGKRKISVIEMTKFNRETTDERSKKKHQLHPFWIVIVI